ncbi:DUF4222 domain-containing protein [Escherichia coli]|uniref:DUF4222 domain-containing protein n=1 Tax=Escherichia coli TaxID=562 RepID=UPI000C86A116|nr:DUF4222 domain-containing protein [Escherichia coli]AUO43115.1 hypothetical protein C0R78_22530 [Escherichia coli]EFE7793596.1 DUF4222 domain-containing protein [Escherichia coli]MCA7834468.1 DUF4222 domain-containing protein [Escherichia coli]
MFRIIQPNTWYADPHGAPCKILRATHEVIHYIRNGRTCIASMCHFQHEFEPLTKAQAERIAEAERMLASSKRHLGDELHDQFSITLADMKPEYVA